MIETTTKIIDLTKEIILFATAIILLIKSIIKKRDDRYHTVILGTYYNTDRLSCQTKFKRLKGSFLLIKFFKKFKKSIDNSVTL